MYLLIGLILGLVVFLFVLAKVLWAWADDQRTFRLPFVKEDIPLNNPGAFLYANSADAINTLLMALTIGFLLFLFWGPALIVAILVGIALFGRNMRRFTKHMKELHKKDPDPNTWEKDS